MDYKSMTMEELIDARREIDREVDRRSRLASAPDEMDALVRMVLDAEGVVEGQPWRQPSGGHNAYPMGWTVTDDDGVLWESTINANPFPPGTEGWRRKQEPGDASPPWEQPGSTNPYHTGDRVTWTDGKVYESTIDNNVWSPADNPAGWQQIDN